jgi:hypothetical protein
MQSRMPIPIRRIHRQQALAQHMPKQRRAPHERCGMRHGSAVVIGGCEHRRHDIRHDRQRFDVTLAHERMGTAVAWPNTAW